MWGLVENLVLPFFSDQLLEMFHDLVSPGHERLKLGLGEKSFRSCCQFFGVEGFELAEELPVPLYQILWRLQFFVSFECADEISLVDLPDLPDQHVGQVRIRV